MNSLLSCCRRGLIMLSLSQNRIFSSANDAINGFTNLRKVHRCHTNHTAMLRLAETFGHEANHGISAQRHPAQGTAIQKMRDDRDAAMRALPLKRGYPFPPTSCKRSGLPAKRWSPLKVSHRRKRGSSVRSCKRAKLDHPIVPIYLPIQLKPRKPAFS